MELKVDALTTAVVGVCHNGAAVIRLVDAIFLEQNYEWEVQRGRYVTLELIAPLNDGAFVGRPAVTILPTWQDRWRR